ncbi:MAG: lipid-A-disaccharide synthase N-terminal domain-containing protein [Ignavibacteriae bacterium]|nr:lipid-A-disaccharide synthase N-terminal domain-containing protein [Ignavibacteriota bacterium]
MQIIGYIGLVAIVICWVPQSIETIKLGRCPINFWFLVLSVIGSIGLAIYAIDLGDPVFGTLNSLTTVGALLNLYYKLFPRKIE